MRVILLWSAFLNFITYHIFWVLLLSHTNTQKSTSITHVLPTCHHPPQVPPLHPHPLTSSPFLPPLLLFLSFLPFLLYCEMHRGREGPGEGWRGLLLAFRWFHMKSQSTHLGCRHWRPAVSHLLPLSIPELAFNCFCTSQTCTNTETGTFASTCINRHMHAGLYKHTYAHASFGMKLKTEKYRYCRC